MDIVLHTALGVVIQASRIHRELLLEQSLYTETPIEFTGNPPTDIIGSGPLDYVLPEGVVLTPSAFDDVVEEEEQTSAVSYPFIDLEVKASLEDQALYQLLAQMHACLCMKSLMHLILVAR